MSFLDKSGIPNRMALLKKGLRFEGTVYGFPILSDMDIENLTKLKFNTKVKFRKK